MQNPGLFTRVSLPHGHATMPAAIAARGGFPLAGSPALGGKAGKPRPRKLRVSLGAATPTPPETGASPAESEESES